jgi:tRNA A-37 threonylcarbamoyl transferase component Bud32
VDKQRVLTAASHPHWYLTVFPGWETLFPDINTVFRVISRPDQILQDNPRGVVSLLRYQQQVFIAKRSKIQERQRRAQATSLYRKGEGARMVHNLARLRALGLPVPEPVLTLEKKRWGCVVASWCVYRYLEGQPCTCADVPRIADLLHMLHQQGWVHRDPHVKNFLLHNNTVWLLDCVNARPWGWRYAQMYDVVLLDKCCPGSLRYYGVSASDPVYRLAKAQNTLIKSWRKIKRRLRRQQA